MDAIRELAMVNGRTVTITLPDHFHARRVEVIVLDADEPATPAAKSPAGGRQPSPLPLAEWLRDALAGSGISGISLDSSIAAAAAELSDIHRDPADRFIIATALATRRRLLTLDSVIRNYPELTGHLA